MPDSEHRTLSAETGFFTLTGFAAQATVHAPLPADHPFYGMVGRVASEWAHLEHTLDLIIWDLAGGDNRRMACITSQIMGVGPRCKAIHSLGKTYGLPDTLLKGFRTLMSAAYQVADTRARWVHDPWYVEKGTETAGQFKSMPYPTERYGIHVVDEAQFDSTISKITDLKATAGALRTAVLDALAASRKKTR